MSTEQSTTAKRIADLRESHEAALAKRQRKAAAKAFQDLIALTAEALDARKRADDSAAANADREKRMHEALIGTRDRIGELEVVRVKAGRLSEAADRFLSELRRGHSPEAAARLALELNDRIEEHQDADLALLVHESQKPTQKAVAVA